MKKLTAILLTLFIVLTFAACSGSESKVSSVSIGAPATSGDWTVNLKSVEFSDTYANVVNYVFLTSATTYTKDGTEFDASPTKPETDENKYVLIELELVYNAKDKTSVRFYSYGENDNYFMLNYDDGYKISPYILYVNTTGDLEQSSAWLYAAGSMANGYKDISIDPLKNNKFLVRGVFEVPKSVETETSKSLIIQLPFGLSYTVR